MNRVEVEKFYDLYRSYYFAAGKRQLFINSYLDEFPTIPYYVMVAAFKNWQKSFKGCYPPTLMEIKERLWKIKLIAMNKLLNDQEAKEFNETVAGSHVDYYDDLLEQQVEFTYDRRPRLSEAQQSDLDNLIEIIVSDLGDFNKQLEGGF